MHARCMRGRAEQLVSGHADPQPCVACRSEWRARNRPLHPAELAEDLSRPRPGGRWSAVAGALQFAEFLEEDAPRLDPASFVTTVSHDTFEEMVRTHGSSPTSSFLLCSLFAVALGLPQGAYVDFPRPREWRAAADHYREILAAYGIRPQDTVLRLPNRRIYILPHVQEFLAGLDFTWEDLLTRWASGSEMRWKRVRRFLFSRRQRRSSGPKTCLRLGASRLPPRRRRGLHTKGQTRRWRVTR